MIGKTHYDRLGPFKTMYRSECARLPKGATKKQNAFFLHPKISKIWCPFDCSCRGEGDSPLSTQRVSLTQIDSGSIETNQKGGLFTPPLALNTLKYFLSAPMFVSSINFDDQQISVEFFSSKFTRLSVPLSQLV